MSWLENWGFNRLPDRRFLGIEVIPLALTEPLRRFLQSQSIMRASPLSSLLALCLTFPLNHLLVSNNYSWSLGMLGAPLVYGIVSWVNAGFLYGYARFASGVWKQNWPGWVPKRVFTRAGFSALLLLGLPGVLQVGAEWWAWEASSLMAGWMGTESLAAQSVLMTVSTVTYCIPLGLSVAASVRIGNLLGSATPHPARAASLASLFLSILFGLSNAAFLQSTRNFWGPLLTSSEPVQKLVAETIPLAAAFQVNDGIAAVGGGVMRGCGYQTLGAIYAGLGFYALGLPLGYLLAFKTNWSDAIRGNFSVTSTDGEEKGEGLKGLWRGLTVGLCAMSLLQTRFVWRLDMGKEVLKARARVGTAQVAKKVTDVG